MATILGFDESIRKKATCHGCGAIISYVKNEVKENYTMDYTGSKEYYHFIHCPNCNNEVIVK